MTGYRLGDTRRGYEIIDEISCTETRVSDYRVGDT